ncbi:hypothetical protein [Streptomyces acidiscabies]|uniref:hypothetical protein n=1 Tax=Streptomyces acidiscabies TaxID=42234 RepID=UPI0027E3F228
MPQHQHARSPRQLPEPPPQMTHPTDHDRLRRSAQQPRTHRPDHLRTAPHRRMVTGEGLAQHEFPQIVEHRRQQHGSPWELAYDRR